MRTYERVILVVMDGVGMGALPDAEHFGDAGADTLGHVVERCRPSLPNLARLGLGHLVRGIPRPESGEIGAWGSMAERSPGKDTTTGHWEIAGLVAEQPFPVYPVGFPAGVMDAFQEAAGRGWLENKPASGTEVIDRLGDEHRTTGKLIVYTSADSVFQIAAHEDVVPIDELYDICRKARAILTGPHAVSRVIARPFVGESGDYRRTANRRDFSLSPPAPTLLDRLKAAGLEVAAVGKIEDIFAGRGMTRAEHTQDNDDGMRVTRRFMDEVGAGLIFTNLVDFDMVYGHRRDPQGMARALEAWDAYVPEILGALRERDILIVTADHGNDPCHTGTDHTREYVPLLCYARGPHALGRFPRDLGRRPCFADLGQTIAQNFGVQTPAGESFLDDLRP